MFGLGKAIGNAISDPVGTVVRTAVSPVTSTIDVVDGLANGELRVKSAIQASGVEEDILNSVLDGD